jgi:sugar lactone lactonase YvrE
VKAVSQSATPECIWPVAAELGEGPLWWDEAVWFVDIKQDRIHRYDPLHGTDKSWNTPAAPGFLAPLKGGKFIAGTKAGLHVFTPDTGRFDGLAAVETDRPGNRLNDGAVDANGRLWFGSMDDAERDPTGSLYCFGREGLKAMDAGYVITNGPAFSPDGRILYHTDTLAKTIYAFDLKEDGAISNKRIFVRIEDGAGFPDGSLVDMDGCLWTGLFGGWAARRYSPKGELLRTVRFPVSNVTKLAFDGTTVYATTAWKGLDAAAREAQPLAGGLFRFEVETPGQMQREVNYG